MTERRRRERYIAWGVSPRITVQKTTSREAATDNYRPSLGFSPLNVGSTPISSSRFQAWSMRSITHSM